MMSGVSATVMFMDAVAYWHRQEQEARLRGLLSIMSLPEVRRPDGTMRRRLVEVETIVGWVAVEAITIDEDGMAIMGCNGVSFHFVASDGVPRWRVDHDVEMPVVIG